MVPSTPVYTTSAPQNPVCMAVPFHPVICNLALLNLRNFRLPLWQGRVMTSTSSSWTTTLWYSHLRMLIWSTRLDQSLFKIRFLLRLPVLLDNKHRTQSTWRLALWLMMSSVLQQQRSAFRLIRPAHHGPGYTCWLHEIPWFCCHSSKVPCTYNSRAGDTVDPSVHGAACTFSSCCTQRETHCFTWTFRRGYSAFTPGHCFSLGIRSSTDRWQDGCATLQDFNQRPDNVFRAGAWRGISISVGLWAFQAGDSLLKKKLLTTQMTSMKRLAPWFPLETHTEELMSRAAIFSSITDSLVAYLLDQMHDDKKF